MEQRFSKLPQSLTEHAKSVRLAGVPTLLVHPDWTTPCPTVLWMHGRTVNKELDPGRYQRWLRAGIATCAIDLPGHGQRAEPGRDAPTATLGVIEQMLEELDDVITELGRFEGAFDPDRLAIGGMSLGGMVTLRRLCDPHPFKAAAVEGTTGDLLALYFPSDHDAGSPWPVDHDPDRVRALDASENMAGFSPIPLLALHTTTDEVVPFEGQAGFIDRLRAHYTEQDADPGMIELKTWSNTGAPAEHGGFGSYGAEAKDTQTEFFVRTLLGSS